MEKNGHTLVVAWDKGKEKEAVYLEMFFEAGHVTKVATDSFVWNGS